MSSLWSDKTLNTPSIINSLDPCLWPIQPFRDYLQCSPNVQLKECYAQPSMTLATMSACLHIVSLLAIVHLLYRGNLAKSENEKQTQKMEQMAKKEEDKDGKISSQEFTINNKNKHIDDLRNMEQDVNNKMKELVNQNERLQENAKHLQKEKSEKLEELNKLQAKLDDKLKKDIAQKDIEMQEMRSHNQELESENTVLRTEMEGLKKSVEVLEDQLVENENELDEKQIEINRLAQIIDDKQDAIMNWLHDNIPDEYVIPQSAHEDERITPILSQLMHRVNKEKDGDPLNPVPLAGPEIDLDMGSPVILPCVAASRVGSDINAALSKAKIGKSQVILIIFHHLAPQNCKISTATEDRLSDRTIQDQCVAIVDAVFWNGSMYDCAANDKAVDKIQKVLRWTVMLEDVMHLHRIVKKSD